MSEEKKEQPAGAYTHRMMRCKLDRNTLHKGRRYRAGELLPDGVEPSPDFEEFTPPPPKVEPQREIKPRKIERLREAPPGARVTLLGKHPGEPLPISKEAK